MTQPIKSKTTSAKAIVAGIGATLTALSTMLATLTVALGDDKIDVGEVASIAGAAAVMISSIYAVWRVPNRVISSQRNQ